MMQGSANRQVKLTKRKTHLDKAHWPIGFMPKAQLSEAWADLEQVTQGIFQVIIGITGWRRRRRKISNIQRVDLQMNNPQSAKHSFPSLTNVITGDKEIIRNIKGERIIRAVKIISAGLPGMTGSGT